MLRFALAVLPLIFHVNTAHPCGALFRSETSANLAIDAQRALMVVHEDTLALHLQLATSSDGQPFSWIVPVPAGSGTPTITIGDDDVFDALDALTTPTVTVTYGDASGGGFCGSADKAGGDRSFDGIQHFGGAALGPYTYDIVAASKTADLITWLESNNYVVPADFDAAIAPYLKDNVFVAVRLSAGTPVAAATNPPLVITWPRPFASGLGYPFGLSKLSIVDSAPLLLWVLADKRQRVANYGSITVDTVADQMRDEGGAYADAIAQLTADAGGRLITTEFAKDLRSLSLPPALAALVDEEAFYLTRLYAEVPRAMIEDLVITFANEAPEVDPHITIAHHDAPIAFASFAFLWLHASSKRRKVGPSSRSA